MSTPKNTELNTPKVSPDERVLDQDEIDLLLGFSEYSPGPDEEKRIGHLMGWKVAFDLYNSNPTHKEAMDHLFFLLEVNRRKDEHIKHLSKENKEWRDRYRESRTEYNKLLDDIA